jgi:hypothetical protein
MSRLLIISLILSFLLSCRSGKPSADASSSGENSPSVSSGIDKKEFTLLYPEEGKGFLTPYKTLLETKSSPQLEMEELIRTYLATTPKANQVNPFPERASLRALYLLGSTQAVVDLDSQAFEGGGSETETYRVYGIINTLCFNFPEIKSAKILVDGQERESLLGHIDLQNPIPPEPSMNGQTAK